MYRKAKIRLEDWLKKKNAPAAQRRASNGENMAG